MEPAGLLTASGIWRCHSAWYLRCVQDHSQTLRPYCPTASAPMRGENEKERCIMNDARSEYTGGSFQTFSYEMPEFQNSKKVVVLARTDRMMAAVQILREGGENNLHSHPNQDGFWMALKGRAKFYGEGDHLIAEIGPLEGILVPRGTSYWFESASDEILELLQVECFNVPMNTIDAVISDRVNHQPLKAATQQLLEADAETGG